MPTRMNLDLDILRTLCVAHDLGGLAQAAEQLGRTPSAISLQMKRLQEDLGISIFRKRGRGLALTEAGELALAYSRRILALNDEFLEAMQGANLAGHLRIGCPQDFATILPSVLSQFATFYPKMQIELAIEGNSALADEIENSQLDLAVVIGQENRPSAKTVGQLRLVWIASSRFIPPADQPLPLAVLGPQCQFRRRIVEHLEKASIPHRVAANSPSLEGLWAALLGGLGITARTAFNPREGLVFAESSYNLPPLGMFPVTLHRNAHSNGAATDRMELLLSENLKLLLSTKQSSKPVRVATARPTGGKLRRVH